MTDEEEVVLSAATDWLAASNRVHQLEIALVSAKAEVVRLGHSIRGLAEEFIGADGIAFLIHESEHDMPPGVTRPRIEGLVFIDCDCRVHELPLANRYA